MDLLIRNLEEYACFPSLKTCYENVSIKMNNIVFALDYHPKGSLTLSNFKMVFFLLYPNIIAFSIIPSKLLLSPNYQLIDQLFFVYYA